MRYLGRFSDTETMKRNKNAIKKNKKLTQEISKLQSSIRYHHKYSVGKLWENASQDDLLNAVSLAVRDKDDRWNVGNRETLSEGES